MNQEQQDDYGGGFDSGFGTDGTEGLLLPPWERRERYGLLNALYLTVKDVMFAPQRFFHRMPTQLGLVQPLLFAVILGVVGAFFNWMWSLAGSSLQVLVADNLDEVVRGTLYAFVAFVLSPLTVTLLVFLWAAIMHLALVLLGGNKLGFEATFRVTSYSVAASVLVLLPFCGAPVGIIWSLVINIVGLYSIHETDPWRTTVAVLGTLLLFLSLVSSGMLAMVLGLR